MYPSYYRIIHHITKLKVTLNWTLDFSSVGFLWDVTEWDLNEKQMYKGVTNDVSGVCIFVKDDNQEYVCQCEISPKISVFIFRWMSLKAMFLKPPLLFCHNLPKISGYFQCRASC